MIEVAGVRFREAWQRGRWRWWVSGFVVSFGVCFGAPLGLAGLAVMVGGIVVSLVLLRCRVRGGWSAWPSWGPADFIVSWGAMSIPLWAIGVGAPTIPAILVWLLAAVIAMSASLLLLFVAPREGLIAWGSLLILGFAIHTGVLEASPARNLQVRVHAWQQPDRISQWSPYKEVDGVKAWIWIVRLPDGGAGPAHDPSRRLSNKDFARDTWGDITGDLGRCEHLFDSWYWCH